MEATASTTRSSTTMRYLPSLILNTFPESIRRISMRRRRHWLRACNRHRRHSSSCSSTSRCMHGETHLLPGCYRKRHVVRQLDIQSLPVVNRDPDAATGGDAGDWCAQRHSRDRGKSRAKPCHAMVGRAFRMHAFAPLLDYCPWTWRWAKGFAGSHLYVRVSRRSE
jgi:hypothetical protein